MTKCFSLESCLISLKMLKMDCSRKIHMARDFKFFSTINFDYFDYFSKICMNGLEEIAQNDEIFYKEMHFFYYKYGNRVKAC